MPTLKLTRLPNRTPIKIAISVQPELNDALAVYAELYHEAFGETVSLSDLISAMLENFLVSDREFIKARKGVAGKARP